ncbi:6480_t:CDS:2 [Ambispora gerdemannii]|uniref:6480_t:CDS:1 n=1 Tax=Ambispora gerdemannii TaxID=144530 RepID=A0A9N9D9J6_9GLOM|nr:6480_t:CDS:2 [Ambispora gerdemannii]
MPKLNSYLIPKENLAKVEEVREIENQGQITPEEQANLTVKNEYPSYEEFMKTYQEDEKVIDNHYYEIDSYGDIRLIAKGVSLTIGPLAIPLGVQLKQMSNPPALALPTAALTVSEKQEKGSELVESGVGDAAGELINDIGLGIESETTKKV